jgi:hypothetical protein
MSHLMCRVNPSTSVVPPNPGMVCHIPAQPNNILGEILSLRRIYPDLIKAIHRPRTLLRVRRIDERNGGDHLQVNSHCGR